MPEIISPIDGRPAYSFDLLSEAAALSRLELAGATARAWRDVGIADRVDLCHRMLDTYAARLDTNAEEITRMMGKPIAQARCCLSSSSTGLPILSFGPASSSG